MSTDGAIAHTPELGACPVGCGQGHSPEALALSTVLSAVLQSVGLGGLGAGRSPPDGGHVPTHGAVLGTQHGGGGRCREGQDQLGVVLAPWRSAWV